MAIMTVIGFTFFNFKMIGDALEYNSCMTLNPCPMELLLTRDSSRVTRENPLWNYLKLKSFHLEQK